jgi:hypothetical protein
VTPVVLDLPDNTSSGDATAIETIKRKLGINVFRGSIFDGADSPAQQVIKQDVPARLLSLNGALDCTDRCDQFGACATSSCPNSACSSCPNSACATAKTALTVEWSAKADDNCPGAAAATSIASTESSSEKCAHECENCDKGAIDVLRNSSSQLEEVAWRFETEDRYEEADSLREAAQQLRVLARGFKQAAAATASGEAPRWSTHSRPVGFGRPAGSYLVPASSGYGWKVHEECEVENCDRK